MVPGALRDRVVNSVQSVLNVAEELHQLADEVLGPTPQKVDTVPNAVPPPQSLTSAVRRLEESVAALRQAMTRFHDHDESTMQTVGRR